MAFREGIRVMANKKRIRALIEDMYREYPDCEFSMRPKKMKKLLVNIYHDAFLKVDDIDMERAFLNHKKTHGRFPFISDIHDFLRNNDIPTSIH